MFKKKYCNNKKKITSESVLIAVKVGANEMNARQREDATNSRSRSPGRHKERSASSLPCGQVWGMQPQSFDLALHLKAGSG